MKQFNSFFSPLPTGERLGVRLLFLASVFLASCSQETALPEVDSQPVEINLNGGISGLTSDGSTRAVVDNSFFTANDLPVSFARVDQNANGSYPDYGTAAALSATRAKGATATAIGFGTSQFYLTRGENNNTKLIGWYPQVGKGSVYAGSVVTFDISKGNVDVMLTQELTGNKADADKFGTSGKQFTFSHLLTQITVKVFGDATAVTNWGKMTSVKVKGQKSACKVSLPATVTFDGTATDVLLKQADADMVSLDIPNGSGSAATCGYAMFPPTTGKTLTLVVTTAKGGTRDITVTLPSSASPQYFAAGTAYTVTLEFKSTTITPSAAIAGWNTDSSSIGGAFPYN